MNSTTSILQHANQVLIGNYARLPVVMHRGEGSLLWDTDGKRYIDLFAGFGGAILGHCHPALIAAATQQMHQLWHVGNTFHTEPQIEVADWFNRTAFTGQAFFCHSGLEANEAGCKLARLRGQDATPRRWKVISLDKSFHGRSLAMIAATGNAAVRQGFAPDVPGFIQVPQGDFAALQAAVTDEVCGIIMEPIQGEGGINFHPPGYAAKVRQLCNDRGLTLIFDEVWSGGGRTGRWFGYQHLLDEAGNIVEPDIITMGKAVGGGLPVGAMFAKPHVAKLLVPGKHGCTLGGNPVCMSVAKTIFEVIAKEKLLDHAAQLGEHAIARFRGDASLKDKIADVRGRGLMLGVELRQPPEQLVSRALQQGIVINLTSKTVIRLAPPINITAELWDQGLDALAQLLRTL